MRRRRAEKSLAASEAENATLTKRLGAMGKAKVQTQMEMSKLRSEHQALSTSHKELSRASSVAGPYAGVLAAAQKAIAAATDTTPAHAASVASLGGAISVSSTPRGGSGATRRSASTGRERNGGPPLSSSSSSARRFSQSGRGMAGGDSSMRSRSATRSRSVNRTSSGSAGGSGSGGRSASASRGARTKGTGDSSPGALKDYS
eukprot:COSAG05_NODE_9097_length_647_cov_19.558981_1_plen_202_part_10